MLVSLIVDLGKKRFIVKEKALAQLKRALEMPILSRGFEKSGIDLKIDKLLVFTLNVIFVNKSLKDFKVSLESNNQIVKDKQ